MPSSFCCHAMWLWIESMLMSRTWAFSSENSRRRALSSGTWAAQVGVQSKGWNVTTTHCFPR
jgi:hypothetical protein